MHRLGLLPTLALVALAAGAAPAAAAEVPCRPGDPASPVCTQWTGKVRSVNDGDTIDVDVWGDRTRRPIRVRIAAIQAMEQTEYASGYRAGECHAVEATERLEQLIRRSRLRVRLTAQHPARRSGRRWSRFVAVRHGRRWRDAGRILVREGHALWASGFAESAWNRDYSRLTQRAAGYARNLFDSDFCRPGPDPLQLRLLVNWDADGDDRSNLNGEWVRLRNHDPQHAAVLDGWSLRATSLRRFVFPPGSVIPPGGMATIHVGEGTTDPARGEYYWGVRRPMFKNATDGPAARGGGAYLYDPDGDIRRWQLYPCRYRCSDPNAGRLALHVKPRGRERITVRNQATWPVALEGYLLDAGKHRYAFGGDVVLQPGASVRVSVNGYPGYDTPRHKRWGLRGRKLRNAGGRVTLRTFTDIEVACRAWGSAAC